MDSVDKEISKNQLAKKLGKVVNEWLSVNDVRKPFVIEVLVDTPTCYYDERGCSHDGRLITINMESLSESDDE